MNYIYDTYTKIHMCYQCGIPLLQGEGAGFFRLTHWLNSGLSWMFCISC